MIKRAITGFVFVILLTGCILLSRGTYLALFSLITAGLLLEFYNNLAKADFHPQSVTGAITGIILYFFSALHASHLANAGIFIYLIPFLIIIYLTELFRNEEKPFNNISHTIIGVVYISVPLSALNYIVFSPEAAFQPHLLLGFFILIWIYDTSAYVIGMSVGKHRLFERISPKKSWEGAVSGLIVACITAMILSHFYPRLNMIQWLLLAIITCIFATFGDLSESMLKRSLNIKDTGDILPGHGGLLDRFDSVLIAAPAAFLYLHIIKLS